MNQKTRLILEAMQPQSSGVQKLPVLPLMGWIFAFMDTLKFQLYVGGHPFHYSSHPPTHNLSAREKFHQQALSYRSVWLVKSWKHDKVRIATLVVYHLKPSFLKGSLLFFAIQTKLGYKSRLIILSCLNFHVESCIFTHYLH